MRFKPQDYIPPSLQDEYQRSRAEDATRDDRKELNQKVRDQALYKAYEYGRSLIHDIFERLKQFPSDGDLEELRRSLYEVVDEFPDTSEYQKKYLYAIVDAALLHKMYYKYHLQDLRRALDELNNADLDISPDKESIEDLDEGELAKLFFFHMTGSKPTGEISYKYNGAYVEVVCGEGDYQLLRSGGVVLDEEDRSTGFITEKRGTFVIVRRIRKYNMTGTLAHEERHLANSIIRRAGRYMNSEDSLMMSKSNNHALNSIQNLARGLAFAIKEGESDMQRIEDSLKELLEGDLEATKDELLAQIRQEVIRSQTPIWGDMAELPERIKTLFLETDSYMRFQRHMNILLEENPNREIRGLIESYLDRYVSYIHQLSDTIDELNQSIILMDDPDLSTPRYTDEQYYRLISLMQNYDFEDWPIEIRKSFREEFDYLERNTTKPILAQVRKRIRSLIPF